MQRLHIVQPVGQLDQRMHRWPYQQQLAEVFGLRHIGDNSSGYFRHAIDHIGNFAAKDFLNLAKGRVVSSIVS